MKKISTLIFACAALCLQSVYAQSNEELETLETIEVDSKQSAQEVLNDQFQSSVKIRQAGTTTVKEYLNQGVTYKVEVDPKDTPAYILSDQDGNGKISNSDTGIDSDVVVPEWTLGNW